MSETGSGLDLAGKAAGGRRLIAIVYADMVGYSHLIGLDDAGTLRRLPYAAARADALEARGEKGHGARAIVGRQEGRYDEAAADYQRTIQLNPNSPTIKNLYWSMAYCRILAGQDEDGLAWANRALAAAGPLPSIRERILFWLQAVAHFRTGDIYTAKRLAAELNDRYPFDTWRERSPGPGNWDSETDRARFQSVQDALKAAGSRDHLDPSADFGVAPEDVLHESLEGKTPTTAPGATTVNTEQLQAMLGSGKPLVIDTMDASWGRSVPGAVGLDFNGNARGTYTDAVQKRLESKMRVLTGGDMTKPIVAMGFNVARFDGYNLALRIRHAAYTNVYWYRGGREAWEVAGLPETAVDVQDW